MLLTGAAQQRARGEGRDTGTVQVWGTAAPRVLQPCKAEKLHCVIDDLAAAGWQVPTTPRRYR